MSGSRQRRSQRRKRRIKHRLRERQWEIQDEPMLRATNVHYDVAERTRALDCGGIGAIHLMCLRTGLVEATTPTPLCARRAARPIEQLAPSLLGNIRALGDSARRESPTT